MHRVVVVALVLALVGGARGQDDDEGLLESPRPDGIPERLEALEREWHEEVGTKDPMGSSEKPDAEDAPELAPGPADDRPEEAEVKAAPPEEPPSRKAPTPLASPLKDPLAGRAASRAATTKDGPASQHGATGKDGKGAPSAKAPAREATSPEE